MDWIMTHSEESTSQSKELTETPMETDVAASDETVEAEQPPPEAKSIKCDEYVFTHSSAHMILHTDLYS